MRTWGGGRRHRYVLLASSVNTYLPTYLLTCMSLCGFQSESKMMTVSALCRLRPTPPARVETRKIQCREPGFWKASMLSLRSWCCVLPSRRRYLYSRSCEGQRAGRDVSFGIARAGSICRWQYTQNMMCMT